MPPTTESLIKILYCIIMKTQKNDLYKNSDDCIWRDCFHQALRDLRSLESEWSESRLLYILAITATYSYTYNGIIIYFLKIKTKKSLLLEIRLTITLCKL